MKKLLSKRVFVLSLAVSVTALSLAGCETQTQSSNATQATQEPAKAAGGNAEPVNLQWFSDVSFWNPPMTWSTDPNTFMGTISKKTGVKFTMNIPPQDGDTKLSLMLVSGDLPDVITVADPDNTTNIISKLVKSGKVWSLDELLKKYDPNSHLLKDFPNDIKNELIKRDGGWYAFPSHISSEDLRKTYPPSSQYYIDRNKYQYNDTIMVNGNMLKEAGIELSSLGTEEGLFNALKKIKDSNLKVNGADVVPLLVDGKNYWDTTMRSITSQFGGMNVDKNGNYRDLIFSSGYKHALEFLNRSVNAGLIDPSQFTMDTNATAAAIVSGRVFAFWGNTANTHYADLQTNQPFWQSPAPVLSSTGAKPVMGMHYRPTVGWMQTFISKTTKEPEKAIKWLSYMSSNEGLYDSVGREGTDFTVDKNGMIHIKEEGAKNDATKTGFGAYWAFANTDWGNHVFEAPTKQLGTGGLMDTAVTTAFARSEKTVIFERSPLDVPPGFLQSKGLGNQETEIKNFVQAEVAKIIMAKDLSEADALYDNMVKKATSMGLDKIDAAKDELMKKQSKEMGIPMKGINE
jgi:putative aldouronate transport system substrate-binding protein